MFLKSCTPPERIAYDTIVGSKAFLDNIKQQNPQCAQGIKSNLCINLGKATAAKDSLIDVVETVCAGPTFNQGGACNFPKKGDSNYQQFTDKLNAAITNYKQAETDLKGVIH